MTIVACLALPVSATVVRFDVEFGGQPAGFIFVELFDSEGPVGVVPAQATVDNFLNYIDDGAGSRRYDGTFIHRKATGFVIQGGGYAYDPALGAFGPTSAPHIPIDATILNEFDSSRSNLRGTIAMAKLGNDPNSATSEWFISLGDNSANLDNQNGGFTVFGQVLGNGMALADAIDALGVVNAGGVFTDLPVVDAAAPATETNLITLAQVVVDPPATISSDSVDSDFGPVVINAAPDTRTVTIQNISGQDLLIGAIGGIDNLVAPFSFPAGGDNCSGQTLVSTATCTIDVEFAPTAIGDFQDSFVIPSNDANQPNLVIMMRGTGTSLTPVLDVTPATLDFGTVGTEQPVFLTVTVSNLGGGQLQPLVPTFSGPDNGAFSLSGNACNNATLDIGQSCTMTIRLLSFSLGNLTAALDVEASDNSGVQMAQVSLLANVSLEPEIEFPDSLTVPDTDIGAQGLVFLSLRNVGASNLYISNVSLQGADAALFNIELVNCVGVAIAPGAICKARITFTPTVRGTFNAAFRILSNDPDSPIDVPLIATSSQDGDGVSSAVEEAAPNNGDGNLDGISDALQDNVASFPDTNGRYVTLEADAGLRLINVRAIPNPSPTNTPIVSGGSLDFQQGFFSFTVGDVPPDRQATVAIYLPPEVSANNYFKYGRFPYENPANVPEHWYEFLFDPVSQTGAEFLPGKIILNFVDGGRGDNDQTVNGQITDPGGPAVLSVGGGSSGGGGCSLLSQPRQSFGRSIISLDFVMLFAALILLRLYSFGCARTEHNGGRCFYPVFDVLSMSGTVVHRQFKLMLAMIGEKPGWASDAKVSHSKWS